VQNVLAAARPLRSKNRPPPAALDAGVLNAFSVQEPGARARTIRAVAKKETDHIRKHLFFPEFLPPIHIQGRPPPVQTQTTSFEADKRRIRRPGYHNSQRDSS
jgi:hypothetical protein